MISEEDLMKAINIIEACLRDLDEVRRALPTYPYPVPLVTYTVFVFRVH